MVLTTNLSTIENSDENLALSSPTLPLAGAWLQLLSAGWQSSYSFATAYAQAPNPFSTAAEHAGKAADAKDLTAIHLHLQHVLNCLEGSTGRDYKKVADNPCTGKGALQTLPMGSANLVRSQKAIALARVGVTLHDVPPSHYVAQAVHAILTEEQQR